MKELNWNGNKFLVYDGIQETPADRYFKFNMYMALEIGIGSDLDAIVSRSREVRSWIQSGKHEEAAAAMLNFEQALQFNISEVSPGSLAFACLVYEANGRKVEDLSDEGLKRSVSEWSKKGLTWGKISGRILDVKKKFGQEVETFFPQLVNTGAVIETAGQLKRRTIAVLKIIQGQAEDHHRATIAAIDEILLRVASPQNYGSYEVERIKGFESSLTIITERLNVDVAKITAFQFIQNVNILKEREEAAKKKKINGQRDKT